MEDAADPEPRCSRIGLPPAAAVAAFGVEGALESTASLRFLETALLGCGWERGAALRVETAGVGAAGAAGWPNAAGASAGVC